MPAAHGSQGNRGDENNKTAYLLTWITGALITLKVQGSQLHEWITFFFLSNNKHVASARDVFSFFCNSGFM